MVVLLGSENETQPHDVKNVKMETMKNLFRKSTIVFIEVYVTLGCAEKQKLFISKCVFYNCP